MIYYTRNVTRSIYLSILLVALTAGCTSPKVPVPTPFEQAVESIGGKKALKELTLLRADATGNVKLDYESPRPSEPEAVSSYETTYLFDLAAGKLRADTVRTPRFEALKFFSPASFSILLDGKQGALTAQAGFVPLGSLPSQYVGALWAQQRLFNPHFYLREGLDAPTLVSDGGAVQFEGHSHRVIHLAGAGGEVRLFVDQESGLISKLETLSNHVLVRDTLTEVRYRDWQHRGSLKFPAVVELYANGVLVQDEKRLEVILEPNLTIGTFTLPAEALGSTLNTEAYAFGQQTHQVLDGFFNLGFVIEEAAPVALSKIAPGLTLVTGGGASSLVVEYDKGLVVFEAPVTPKHGAGLIESFEEAFPDSVITHIVQSHHHQDHAAGLRSFVAADVTALVGHGVGDFWRGVFSAESTVRPDVLAKAPVTPKLEELPLNGRLVIHDDSMTITIHHVPANPHADDMVIGVIRSGGEIYVFEADLYNAGYGLTLVLGGPESLFAILRDLGVIDTSCRSDQPLTIIPAHGVPVSLADALTELAGQKIDVGC